MNEDSHEGNQNDFCIEVLKTMEPKIKKTLFNIPINYRDDVGQDLKIKIMQTANKIKYEDTPGFFEFDQNVRRRMGIGG